MPDVANAAAHALIRALGDEGHDKTDVEAALDIMTQWEPRSGCPPSVLEGLAKLVSTCPVPLSKRCARVLVSIASQNPRDWRSLSTCGLFAIEHVPEVVTSALLRHESPSGHDPLGQRVSDNIVSLCTLDSLRLMRRGGVPAMTPLEVAVVTVLRQIKADLLELLRGNNRDAESEDGEVAEEGCDSVAPSSVERLRSLLLAESVPLEAWNTVHRDYVADIVCVLVKFVSSADSTECLAGRVIQHVLATRFSQPSLAAGRVCAALTDDKYPVLAETRSLVADWVNQFHGVEGFAWSFCRENFCPRSPDYPLAGDCGDLSGSCSLVLEYRSMLGREARGVYDGFDPALYIVCPDEQRVVAMTEPCALARIRDTNLCIRGPIDRVIESGLTSLLELIPSLEIQYWSLCAHGVGGRDARSDARDHATADSVAMSLRRASLSHPYLVFRRLAAICSSVEFVLEEMFSKPTAPSAPRISCVVITRLLTVIATVLHAVSVTMIQSDVVGRVSAVAVKRSLGFVDKANELSIHFAEVIDGSCRVLRRCAAAPHEASCKTCWRDHKEFRDMIRRYSSSSSVNEKARTALRGLVESLS